MLTDPDQFNDILEGVRAVCAEFPDDYHRKIDHERAYPEAFVAALTKTCWIATLIPEEYGGLVVHGPLQAKLMAHMVAEIHGQAPTRFSFRGKTPISHDAPLMLHATDDDDELYLWTAREDGLVTMQAKAGWS